MNKITFKCSYLTKQISLSINGEAVSPYSNLFALCNRSFEELAFNLLKNLDNEIYDDYEIDMFSSEFQFEILKSFQSESEFCKKIHQYNMDMLMDSDQILDSLSLMNDKYNLQIQNKNLIKVIADADVIIPPIINLEKITNKETGVDLEIGRENNKEFNAKINVLICEKYGINKKNGKYIFKVPENEIDKFWEYFILYEYKIPQINEYFIALKYKKLLEEDKIILESIKSGKEKFYLETIPNVIEKGTSKKIQFVSFPKNAFKMQSSKQEVIAIQDDEIFAIREGNGGIEIVDRNGNVIENHLISVVSHKYVEKITLIPRFEYLKKNERNHVDIVIEPRDSEDASFLEWSSSNVDVVQVDNKGNVTAIQEGKVFVSVTGKQTHESIEIEVKPELTGLYFNTQKLSLRGGETKVINCMIDPPNAASGNLRWEMDNRTIANINPSKDGQKCQIIASTKYQGSGNIKCYSSEKGFSAVCPVEVRAVKRKGKGCLIAIIIIILIIIIFFN